MKRGEQNKDRETPRTRLSAQDWADAALAAVGEGGLAAIAVEPLATRLGATKGSCYWHFANRAALIEATLTRWEQIATDAVIVTAEADPDPEHRLRTLFARVVIAASENPVELALLSSAAHPQVAAALHRVTERRMEYVAVLFAELGFPREEARRRSLLAYSAYLGHAQLAHSVPQLLPEGAERRRYLESTMTALLQRS
ncbi:TetR/AcrR family transcriptional regulator [Streptomyces sp. NPDC058611]|uniref:TetR/AcrR family transcriptional regulator n=1 Tax=unclassified Streptomyces TaxID=2593676 RepID=UPI003657536B